MAGSKFAVHTRYRNKAGAIVPGVTTVIALLAKPALIPWAHKLGLQGLDMNKVRDNAADIGTLTHYLCECILTGVKPDVSEYKPSDLEIAQACADSYGTWWKKSGLKLVHCEHGIVSEKWQFGGTIDLIATDKEGRYYLLDLKTSKGIYDEYKIQLSTYKEGWEELNPKKPIYKVIVVHIDKETADLSLHQFSDDLKNFFEIFKHLRAIYVLQKMTDPKRRNDDHKISSLSEAVNR